METAFWTALSEAYGDYDITCRTLCSSNGVQSLALLIRKLVLLLT
jgi:hypothetical protein